ncbi:MAG: tetratricopeptide repeat protein [Candidatus Protistobacter heckmanni]|nr:tetratricopeptide repeat protein [Candidatus Protistobacter heckmanni]
MRSTLPFRRVCLLPLALAGAFAGGQALAQPAKPPSAQGSAQAQQTRRAAEEKLPAVELSDRIVFLALAADIAAQRGQPIQAIQAYTSLARSTRDPRFARRAVEIGFTTQHQLDALEAARLWYEISPQLEGTRQVLQMLLVLSGKLDEALPFFAQQLDGATASERGDAILVVQQQLARAPNPADGVQLLKRLLARDPKDMQRPESHLALARAYLLAQDKAQAVEEAELSLKLKPDDEEAVIFASGIDHPDRNAQYARLERFIDRYPQAVQARMQLARMLIADGRETAAQVQFTEIIKRNPNDAQANLALALVDIQAGRLDEAEQLMRNLIKAYGERIAAGRAAASGIVMPKPRAVQLAYQNMARIAEARGDLLGAAEWLNKIDDPSMRVQTQVQRARLLAKAGRIGEAQAVFEDLRQADDLAEASTPQARLALSRTEVAVLMEAKRYDLALAKLRVMLREQPNDADLWYDAAMASEKLDDLNDMEASLRKTIDLQPDMYHAYNTLGYSLADRNLRLGEAQELVSKAMKLAPSDPYILDSMGWVQYRMGNLKEARATLSKAFEIKPEAEIGAHFGEVLWGLGEQEQARKIWRTAQQLDPANETLRQTLARFLKPDEINN